MASSDSDKPSSGFTFAQPSQEKPTDSGSPSFGLSVDKPSSAFSFGLRSQENLPDNQSTGISFGLPVDKRPSFNLTFGELSHEKLKDNQSTSNSFEQPVGISKGCPEVKMPLEFKSTRKQFEFNLNALQKKDTPVFVEASTQTEEELGVNKLIQGLGKILLNSKYSDFILDVKGTEFKVHRIILEAQSPVFAAMLEHDTKEKADGVANINDCEPLTITKFLSFLYTGRMDSLDSDSVLHLYGVADKYQVTELSSLCIKYMIDNISIENFCDTLSLSLQHHVRELTEIATQFFLQNSTKIAVTAKWQTFLTKNPITGNELFLKALNLKKE